MTTSSPLLPLHKTSYELLPWTHSDPFHYPGLTRIRTIPGPSSFLHAILNAFSIPYRSTKFNNQQMKRSEMIQVLRERLTERLTELVDPNQSQDVRYYDILSKGKYREISDAIKSYSLPVMQSELYDETFFIDDKYLELIGDYLVKDIYIFDGLSGDVYTKSEDPDLFYKNRDSIVILAFPQHFETLGVDSQGNGDIKTHFDPASPFIQKIRYRYDEIYGQKSKLF